MAFDLKATKKGARKRAPIRSAGAVDDPLAGVEYTDDLAADCRAEFQALDEAYRERAKREDERFVRATDSEFWFAVCFEDREEKEAFLRAAKVRTAMLGDKYLRGRDLAAALGIDF